VQGALAGAARAAASSQGNLGKVVTGVRVVCPQPPVP
jgi:hypothetical protein